MYIQSEVGDGVQGRRLGGIYRERCVWCHVHNCNIRPPFNSFLLCVGHSSSVVIILLVDLNIWTK